MLKYKPNNIKYSIMLSKDLLKTYPTLNKINTKKCINKSITIPSLKNININSIKSINKSINSIKL